MLFCFLKSFYNFVTDEVIYLKKDFDIDSNMPKELLGESQEQLKLKNLCGATEKFQIDLFTCVFRECYKS